MTGPYSGRWGVVDGITTVQNWTINDAMESKRYTASNTKFGKGSRRGVESWDGNYMRYGGVPVVLPGQQFAFLGYGAPVNNVSGTGWRYAGQALCEQAVVTWNWGAGDILTCQETFKGHLDLQEQGDTGAQVLDESVPTVPPVACTKIEWSPYDVDNFNEWGFLVQAVLTMSMELQPYVNSSTVVDDGGICRIWTGQRAGIYDWTLSVTEQGMDRSLFVKGQKIQLKCYVDDTDFYLLKWGQVKDFTGIDVNPNTGAIIQQTVMIEMDGFDPAAGSYASATGEVLLPGGEQWWPFSGSGTGT